MGLSFPSPSCVGREFHPTVCFLWFGLIYFVILSVQVLSLTLGRKFYSLLRLIWNFYCKTSNHIKFNCCKIYHWLWGPEICLNIAQSSKIFLKEVDNFTVSKLWEPSKSIFMRELLLFYFFPIILRFLLETWSLGACPMINRMKSKIMFIIYKFIYEHI